ncbi:phage terminase large subunit family protein [Methylobacterium bullatum]|uniref:Phage terminase large subunit (GpA) n=1 Tax=Methylobacterium bullatum TaxID=570505 RepID=A0AAV4ZEN8_9HYPH|nr:phage terminase large subunit family protein [Methylobacterium bullatum]MBD8902913.1 terminase [Methylobacterium bullatum]GJD41950.1 hypothetical protein OICFNHDK_4436 [Methylobacterium bullatum]
MRAIEEVRRRAFRALIPPPRMPLSEWIEREMRLPEAVSALPGRVRLWPYQREIADAITDPAVERVSLVKPVRVGFSTILSGAVASYVANEPSPILVLLPTEADCRDYTVSDLEPIFEATPCLHGLLSAEADETGRNTLSSRRFPGGSLKIVAAKSPRNLRRHNVRILLMDEVDGMEVSKEGDPITLAERRTLSFANRKIIMGSTPVHEETSNVLRAYAQSDARVFEVPCKLCGSFSEIQWAHIEWATGRPETAAFRCPHCEEIVDEKYKPEMVEAGRWRATRPEVKGHAGFRLNALVSCLANASWAKLATEFVAATGHPDKLQTFVNTILAQGWRESAEELDEAGLASRRERFGLDEIPAPILMVTTGIDVQDDRLELTFLGHSRTETFVLAHMVIWGSPLDNTTWYELDELLKSRWPHPLGGTIGVDAAVIDSGDGGVTDAVYGFTRPRFNRKIMSGKGVSGFQRPAIQKSQAKGVPLFLVGVDALKAQLLSRLSRGRDIRFSDSLEPRYFEELTSERRVVRYRSGRPERVFERISGRRAECLDCFVYAIAARGLLTLDPDRREAELSQIVVSKKSSNTIRSAWLDRRA